MTQIVDIGGSKGWLAQHLAETFGGKAFGRTPLGAISPAAGATSPSKTVEGALSGIAATAVVATLGARAMGWPAPLRSGPLYGALIGVVALLGDLTASMFKRDARLTGKGRKQAGALQLPMQWMPFDLVVVSPLSRTIETATAGWKSERRGRCGCIFSIGVAYENAMEAVISSQDVAIIWRSDERAPPRESAEKTYAEMIDSSIMICCCSAESSVHRP